MSHQLWIVADGGEIRCAKLSGLLQTGIIGLPQVGKDGRCFGF